VKTSFLEYLTLISKQGKNLPLSVEQRVSLVKSLLNSRLKKFDFDVIGVPESQETVETDDEEDNGEETDEKEERRENDEKEDSEDNEEYPTYEACEAVVDEWDAIYDDLWVHLSATSLNLEFIRENRPQMNLCKKLNKQVFDFKNLICLETNSIIDTGKYNLFLK